MDSEVGLEGTAALLARAEVRLARARALLARLGLVGRWARAGAEAHLVGSVATGLLGPHLDIDLHVYTAALRPEAGFAIAAALAPLRLDYRDGSRTEERCLEWHLWVRDGAGETWQIDVIQLAADSPYRGFVERRSARIRAALTDETRAAILRLKEAAPAGRAIPGIQFCAAVLCDGVRTWGAFERWLAGHSLEGILEWCP